MCSLHTSKSRLRMSVWLFGSERFQVLLGKLCLSWLRLVGRSQLPFGHSPEMVRAPRPLGFTEWACRGAIRGIDVVGRARNNVLAVESKAGIRTQFNALMVKC